MKEFFISIAVFATFALLAGGAMYLFLTRRKGGTPRSGPPPTADEQRLRRLQALEKLRQETMAPPLAEANEDPDSGWVDAEEGEGEEDYEHEEIRSTTALPIQGKPEFIRAAELQRAYWTFSEEERARLVERGPAHLSWRERLRLHHLTCMGRLACLQIKADPALVEKATNQCRALSYLLLSATSPYLPRPALIWDGYSAREESNWQGELLNPSLTHLGCLEIYRLDAANQPSEIDFVGFAELSGIVFDPRPYAIVAARLFYDDGRTELVLVPRLYGLTWAIGTQWDRAGSLTRFVAALDETPYRVDAITAQKIGLDLAWAPPSSTSPMAGFVKASKEGREYLIGSGLISGLGVGQQRLVLPVQKGAHALRLGAVGRISFLVDTSHPQFDERARASGLDPDEVRRQLGC